MRHLDYVRERDPVPFPQNDQNRRDQPGRAITKGSSQEIHKYGNDG